MTIDPQASRRLRGTESGLRRLAFLAKYPQHSPSVRIPGPVRRSSGNHPLTPSALRLRKGASPGAFRLSGEYSHRLVARSDTSSLLSAIPGWPCSRDGCRVAKHARISQKVARQPLAAPCYQPTLLVWSLKYSATLSHSRAIIGINAGKDSTRGRHSCQRLVFARRPSNGQRRS